MKKWKEITLKALRRELSDVQDDIARSDLQSRRMLANRDLSAYSKYHLKSENDEYLAGRRTQEKEILDAIRWVEQI